MKLLHSLVTAVAFAWLCLANDLNKKQWPSWQQTTQYWTPATTQYWAATTSYQSVWVGTSTSTVYVYITQQANVVVTMTSYVPCVVTSTTWVYQCQGGCPTYPQAPGGAGGTVTVTSYAEVTGQAQVITRTVTSGSYVLAIIEAASASVSSGQGGFISRASTRDVSSAWLPAAVLVASVFSLMIWL